MHEDGEGDGDGDGLGLGDGEGDGDGDDLDGNGDGEDLDGNGDGEVGNGSGEDEDGNGNGSDEDEDGNGDGDGGGDGEDDDKDDGWSATCCTVMGWFEALGPCGEPVAARAIAVPAATTAITTPAAMAASSALTCRRLLCRCLLRRPRKIRCAVKPCTSGGWPDGHSAASSSAASPRCDRPLSSQSRPYAPEATAWSSATKVIASFGRRPGSLAIPAATSGRSGPGTGSSGTGSKRCWRTSSAAVSPLNGGRPVRHS